MTRIERQAIRMCIVYLAYVPLLLARNLQRRQFGFMFFYTLT